MRLTAAACRARIALTISSQGRQGRRRAHCDRFVDDECRITRISHPVRSRRVHRELKAKVTKPATANAKCQQRVFNLFVQTDNHVRPHEALLDETPASRWHTSARPFPPRITPPSYHGHFEVRRVSGTGRFRLHNGRQVLSEALNDEMTGLEAVHDGLWNVIYP